MFSTVAYNAHMSNVTNLDDSRLRRLRPEPWGSRLARARDEAGYTLRSIAELLDGHNSLSRGTIQRLEALDEAPIEPRDRRRAFTLVVVYGFEPSDFDLGPDDVPPVVDLNLLADLGKRSTSWYRRPRLVTLGFPTHSSPDLTAA